MSNKSISMNKTFESISIKFNKMNQNDKRMILILLVAVIGFLCYSTIISPAWDQAIVLKEQENQLKTELSRANELIANLPQIRVEEKNKKTILVNKYNAFFYELNQEQMIYNLDTIFKDNGIVVDSFTANSPKLLQISYGPRDYKPLTYPLLDIASKTNLNLVQNILSQAAPDAAVANTESAPDILPCAIINIGFSSASYESIISFTKAMESLNKTMIIESVNLTKGDNPSGLSGQIQLALFVLPKLDETEKDYWKFSPIIPLGKANPFI